MNSKIKGIVVEIGGDTSALQDALKDVNNKAASLSKELKGINSLLKLDPKNVTLLKQKQEVLTEEIQQTTTQLETFKKALADIDSGKTKATADEYRALQREIILTENKLRDLQNEASGGTILQKLETIGNSLVNVGNKITDIGKKASVASAAVGALFAAGIKYNADIETATKSYEAFIGSAEEAEAAVEAIRKQSQTSPFNTTDLIKANQMLISTGISADEARNTISALADAIALTGGGNDELTRMASNLQQIQNAGKATSMDIRQFAYAGIDVYGILAETTGKNVEEIKKMDITYEELSKALQAAASEGGKYYKGQEQGASTLNGQVNQLKKSFQDLLGELSKSLMPILKSLTKSIQGLIKWFSGLNQQQKDMITKIGLIIAALGPALIILGKIITIAGTIFGAFSKVFGIMAKIAPIIGSVASKFTFLLNPITAVIAAVVGIGVALMTLYKKNEAFREKFDAAWNGIKTLVVDVIVPAIQNAFDFIKGIIANIGKAVLNLWEKVKNIVTTAINTIQNIWNSFTGFIQTGLNNILNFLIGIASGIYNNVISPIAGFFMNTLVPIITGAIGTITNVFSGIVGTLSGIWEGIKGIFDGAISFITDTFGTAWSNAWQGIADVFMGIWNGIADGIKGVINVLIGALNGFINAINKISFDVPDWVPVIGGKTWGFNIPTIPELATGGIVDQATLAMIGEGRSPEAVIPLDKTLTRYMAEALRDAGMVGMTINFYPQKMTDAELERSFNYINRRFGMAY